MITKQQYLEVLNRAERFLKIRQKSTIPMSQDYQFGFMAAIDIVKNLVKELQ